MSGPRRLAPEVMERIRKARRRDPDVSTRELAERFGVSTDSIARALAGTSPVGLHGGGAECAPTGLPDPAPQPGTLTTGTAQDRSSTT